MKSLRKLFRRLVAIFLVLAVIVTLLCASLYFQPMQRWAINGILSLAGQQSGTRITVADASLSWPLCLTIDSLLVEEPSTEHQSVEVLWAERVEADVQVMPLLAKQVMIDKLRLHNARINSTHYVPDMLVRGQVEELAMTAHGINLLFSSATLDETLLKGARLHVELADTARDDEPMDWRVKMERMRLENSTIDLLMAPDSTDHRDRIMAHVDMLTLHNADMRMDKGSYQLDSIAIYDGRLSYNNTMALNRLHGLATHLVYNSDSLAATIAHATASETKTGLQLDTLAMRVSMVGNQLSIPTTRFVTPQSAFSATMDVDLSMLNDTTSGSMEMPSMALSLKKKKLSEMASTPIMVNIKGAFHKQDLLRLAKFSDKGVPWALRQVWPNKAIKLGVTVRGDMKKLKISGFKGELPDEVKLGK